MLCSVLWWNCRLSWLLVVLVTLLKKCKLSWLGSVSGFSSIAFCRMGSELSDFLWGLQVPLAEHWILG